MNAIKDPSLTRVTTVSPRTPREKIALAAAELGYMAIKASCRFAEIGLVLVPRELGPSVNDTILVKVLGIQTPRVHARSLEVVCRSYIKNIEKLEKLTGLPFAYSPLVRAINSTGKYREPGGDYAWWQICSPKNLLDSEHVYGPFVRQKLPPRNKKVLYNALFVPEAKPPVPKLIPKARDFNRLRGNLLRRKPR